MNNWEEDRLFKVVFSLKGSEKTHTEMLRLDEEYGAVPDAFRILNKKYNNKVEHILDVDLIEEEEK